MRFTKMHGLGNDYVYVNCFEETIKEPERAARAVSDRHCGIGADGLILIQPSEKADCRMEMYNADGSRGAMCGNGIRCVAKYVVEAGMLPGPELSVETDSGIRRLRCRGSGGKVRLVDVEMGLPLVDNRENLETSGGNFTFTPVSMGNPHAVLFYEAVDGLPVERIGPLFETHERFPDRTNVEFAQVVNARTMYLRVWERGSGETMACGTGACAACAAAMSMGLMKRQVSVYLAGGRLEVTWPGPASPMILTGPAVTVFQGEIVLEDLTLYRE